MSDLRDFEAALRELFKGRQSGGGAKFDKEENPGSVSINTLEHIGNVIENRSPSGIAGGTFLDIGSGFGLPLAHFATVAQKCVGIEFNQGVARESLWHIQDHCPESASKIRVIRGDVRKVLGNELAAEANLILCNDILFDDEASEFVKQTIFQSFLHSPKTRTGWVFSGKPMVAHERWAWDRVKWRVPMDVDILDPTLKRILTGVTKISVAEGRLWGGSGDHFAREMVLFCAEFTGSGLTLLKDPPTTKKVWEDYFPLNKARLATKSIEKIANALAGIRQLTAFNSGGDGMVVAKLSQFLGESVEIISVESDEQTYLANRKLNALFDLAVDFREMHTPRLHFFEHGIATYYAIDCDEDDLAYVVKKMRERPADLEVAHRTILMTTKPMEWLTEMYGLSSNYKSLEMEVIYSIYDCSMNWMFSTDKDCHLGWKTKIYFHHFVY